MDHRELIMMPKGAKPLALKMQNDLPVLYALVDPDAPPVPRVFRSVTSGEAFNDEIAEYIGTDFGNGWFAIHLFEVVGKGDDPIDPRWKGDFKEYHEELSPL